MIRAKEGSLNCIKECAVYLLSERRRADRSLQGGETVTEIWVTDGKAIN
jgi:hypothetical protein